MISQRAKANDDYNLKNLTGHGRFDIIIRCILSAGRHLVNDSGDLVYCYLKGSTPHGWLAIPPDFIAENDDEISFASKLQKYWDQYFVAGTLDHLVDNLPRPFILLHESGERLVSNEGTFILGAQRDLTEGDMSIIQPDLKISLGDRSLLASQTITYTRQMQLNIS